MNDRVDPPEPVPGNRAEGDPIRTDMVIVGAGPHAREDIVETERGRSERLQREELKWGG